MFQELGIRRHIQCKVFDAFRYKDVLDDMSSSSQLALNDYSLWTAHLTIVRI